MRDKDRNNKKGLGFRVQEAERKLLKGKEKGWFWL
jgi:hypothetical protein